MEKEYQLKLKERKHEEIICAIKSEFEGEKQVLKSEIEEINSKFSEAVEDYEQKLKEEILKSELSISNLEESHCKQIAREIEKYKILTEKYDSSVLSNEKTIKSKDAKISDLNDEFDEKIICKDKLFASNTLELNSEIENLKNSNKITLEHLEKEREYEICSLKNEFDSKIRQEQENLLR